MGTVRKEAKESARKTLPVAAIVKSVAHAVTARKPTTRYRVGRDS
jgi:hypothetical protein